MAHQVNPDTLDTLDRIPGWDQITAASKNPTDLLKLGEKTVEFLETLHGRRLYDTAWTNQLRRQVAVIKDAKEASVPHFVAVEELRKILLNPVGKESAPPDEEELPSVAELEGGAWGSDASVSAVFFAVSGVLLIVGLLSLLALEYAFDTPGQLAAFTTGSLAWVALSISASLL